MRLTFATFVLISAFFETSAVRIPFPRPPKLPGTPNTPNKPNTPNTPNTPGRLPGPNTPNTPGRPPVAGPCSGRRRAIACAIDSKDWNDLEVETKYRRPGADAIAELDSIKSHPRDANPNTEDIDKKYTTAIKEGKDFFDDELATDFLGTNEDTLFVKFVVKNQEEKVDELIKKIRVAGGDQRDLGKVAGTLKETPILQTQSNVDLGLIGIEQSFARKYDVYRDYDKDGLERPAVTGNSRDAIRWKDQVMDGWKKAISKKDPKLTIKDVPLNYIIRAKIITDDTNNVIKAAMDKAGRMFGLDKDKKEDYIEFFKNGENKEEFEAIAGTLHGKGVIDMLKEYVLPL